MKNIIQKKNQHISDVVNMKRMKICSYTYVGACIYGAYGTFEFTVFIQDLDYQGLVYI